MSEEIKKLQDQEKAGEGMSRRGFLAVTAAAPGADSGKSTRRNACQRPAPHKDAACNMAGSSVRMLA